MSAEPIGDGDEAPLGEDQEGVVVGLARDAAVGPRGGRDERRAPGGHAGRGQGEGGSGIASLDEERGSLHHGGGLGTELDPRRHRQGGLRDGFRGGGFRGGGFWRRGECTLGRVGRRSVRRAGIREVEGEGSGFERRGRSR